MTGETSKPKSKPLPVGAYVTLMAFGAAVFFGGWAAGLDASEFAALDESGVRVDATVLDARSFSTGHGDSRTKTYEAQVRFDTPQGEEHTGTTRIDEKTYTRVKSGPPATIRIAYLPSDPDTFRLEGLNAKEKRSALIVSWVLRIVGGLMMIVGLYSLLRRGVQRG